MLRMNPPASLPAFATHLAALARPTRPWDNGGGVTRDLVDDGHASWRWRLSLADIDADGPFSAMPGVERWFAVADGEGVALTIDGTPMVVRPLDPPLVFDGALAPHCQLLNGPVRALNLMLRDGARGVLRRAGRGVVWSEDWPLRGHFVNAGLVLDWGAPPGPLAARGEGCWIGVRA